MTKLGLMNLLLGCLVFLCATAEHTATPVDCAASHGLRLPTAGRAVEWNYTLTARVRLLAFWISREGVGGGRITSIQEPGGTRGLELLIGSDPARAPMRINRWGYVAERATGTSAELIGVMTAAEEQSIHQARTAVTQPTGRHLYKAIRGGLKDNIAHSTVFRLPLAQDFTYRDLDALLCILPQTGTGTRSTAVPGGIEPGFLFAVKSLLHDAVAFPPGNAGGVQRARRTYVYDACLFELTRTSCRILPEILVNGRRYRNAMEGDFQALNTVTGKVSRFSIVFGTDGPNAEMPIRIVYRPRWWFEAELLLDEVQ